jgi:exopolysaccharide biosynthesis polyprenyl glycosylphosphotransferase
VKNNSSFVYTLALILGDFLALIAAFASAYFVRFRVINPELASTQSGTVFLYAVLSTLPLWIIAQSFIGLYRQEVFDKRFSELGRLFVGSFLGILTVIGYDFMTGSDIFPGRLVPVYGLLIGFTFLVIFRNIARAIRRALFTYGYGVTDVLIIGDTPISLETAHIINDTRHSGQRVVGIVGKKSSKFAYYKTFQDSIKDLPNLPQLILHTELYKRQDMNNQILQYAQEQHISYRFLPGNSDMFAGNIHVDLFAGRPVIAVHQTSLVGWGRLAKRLFDIFFSSLLLLLLSPLLIIVGVLNLLSSGGIFFRQIRLTRFNSEFSVFKFRSQYKKYDGTTPEEAFQMMSRPELSKEYRDNGDFLQNDPRVTKFGRFLRASSIDELPQLINVIKGDLSLVGPRALIPQELSQYEKKHAILSVKSGITGLAQVSGRRSISFAERRKLDMFYVQNWSFWLDVTILLKTFRAVLTGNGAK